MLDLRLTFDITPAFAQVLRDLADALRGRPEFPHDIDPGIHYAINVGVDDSAAQAATENVKPADADNPTPEDESAAVPEPKAEPVADEAQADEPAAPVEKPKRGRPKKAPESRVGPEVVESSSLPAGAENAPQMEASREPQAESVQAPMPEPAKVDDPYCGMSLLQAVQKILELATERGQELADVNARVREACAERGLNYPSATTLVKAIGYTEAAAIALGEK